MKQPKNRTSEPADLDDDMRQTRPYDAQAQAQDSGEGSGDRNEGEGSRTAAKLYNDHATEFAADPDRVERAAKDAERAEDEDEDETGDGHQNHGGDGADGVSVKFDGQHWCVMHTSLDHALTFSNLDDAEHRASELGREAGQNVVVYDQAGAVLASYTLEH